MKPRSPLTELDAAHRIKCSCGAETILIVDTTDKNGRRRIPLAASWKCRTVSEAEAYEASGGGRIGAGWYCGKPDHEFGGDAD